MPLSLYLVLFLPIVSLYCSILKKIRCILCQTFSFTSAFHSYKHTQQFKSFHNKILSLVSITFICVKSWLSTWHNHKLHFMPSFLDIHQWCLSWTWLLASSLDSVSTSNRMSSSFPFIKNCLFPAFLRWNHPCYHMPMVWHSQTFNDVDYSTFSSFHRYFILRLWFNTSIAPYLFFFFFSLAYLISSFTFALYSSFASLLIQIFLNLSLL